MLRKLHAVSLSWILASSLSLVAASPVRAAQAGDIIGPPAPVAKTGVNPVEYVNPFIGTGRSAAKEYTGGGSGGNTFPGVTTAFGMVQWSPDTASSFSPEESGSYVYRDNAIRGFSLTHLDGPGCSVYAGVPFMPLAGEFSAPPTTGEGAYLAQFSHADEKARPGSYEVTLDSGIKVRLTAITRTGYGEFAYPSSRIPVSLRLCLSEE